MSDPTPRHDARRPWCAPLLLLPLLACGGGPSAPTPPGPEGPRTPSPDAGFPLELVNPDGSSVALEAAPVRVVPANTAAFDVLGELGALDLVSAVPEQVLTYARHEVDVDRFDADRRFASYESERLIVLEPDLVLASPWQDAAVHDTLRSAGIPVLVLRDASTWDQVEADVLAVATALGRPAEGARLLEDYSVRIDDLAARASASRPRVLSVSSTAGQHWVAGEGSTAAVFLRLAGCENAAAELDGSRQVDAERLLALDPAWIVVGASVNDPARSTTAEALRSDPVLAGLSAVAADRIVVLPPALFTASSPALLDAAEALRDAIDA